jgi:hypothetical protein
VGAHAAFEAEVRQEALDPFALARQQGQQPLRRDQRVSA